MDMFSRAKRSAIMACIVSTNTAPERVVRSALHALGYRFRLHRRDLAGCPDVVLPKHKVALFVHGCFWHGHTCKDGRRPKSNKAYWNQKLDRNAARDKKNMYLLKKAGWRRVVIWECQTRDERHLVARLEKAIRAK